MVPRGSVRFGVAALARVSATLSIRLEDFIDLGRTQLLRLHEKGGVQRDIPVHPRLVEYLDSWIAAAGLRPSDFLFPAFDARGTVQTPRQLSRSDVLRMVKRRLTRAGSRPCFPITRSERPALRSSFRTAGAWRPRSSSRTTRTAGRPSSTTDAQRSWSLRR